MESSSVPQQLVDVNKWKHQGDAAEQDEEENISEIEEAGDVEQDEEENDIEKARDDDIERFSNDAAEQQEDSD